MPRRRPGKTKDKRTEPTRTVEASLAPDEIWAPLRSFLPVFAVFIIGACLLCWNLGARYLWQDEANTAVLARRMMSYGRPLAYDGRNLISRDFHSPEDYQELPTGDPAESIRYHVMRGDFKADTTWIEPWGQFVAAGVSLALLGNNTIPARLPFALAGALTAALLYAVVRKRLASPVAAAAAAALVVGNSFWVMHMRQCRYYALSSLSLLVTVEAYFRWREGRRWGGLIFIGAAWLWFQMDYGSVWPVLAVLGVHAIITRARSLKETILVFTGFCVVTAPFCFFYELAGRTKHTATEWSDSLGCMLFEVNQFQFPFIMIPVVLYLLWSKRKDQWNTGSHSLVGLCLAIICALTIWMPLVGPFPYYRYLVPASTLSALVIAYGTVELARLIPHSRDIRWLVPCTVAAATLLFLFTNLPSWPGALVFPNKYRLEYYLSSVVRPEIRLLISDLTDDGRDDPNRATVEFLRQHLRPDDEILCNYEDKPLIFYLPNLVRGGVSCFRVTDKGHARFAVYRRRAGFTHGSIYTEVNRKSVWQEYSMNAPDIVFGNCPDPRFHYALLSPGSPPLEIFERVPE